MKRREVDRKIGNNEGMEVDRKEQNNEERES
jgi:hypothetical protein